MKASFLGMYFLVFYGTFKSVSWEYAEAAIIDGAGHFRIMFNIMMPLIKKLGGGVRFIAGTDNGIVENGARRILSLGEYRHWIDLMRKGGADGIYFFNFPLRPYRDEAWRGILGEKAPAE